MKAEAAGTRTSTIVAAEYSRNQPLDDVTASTSVTRTKGLMARSPCIVSVNVAGTPRMCIGKQFHKTRLSTAFAQIIDAIRRRERSCRDDLQTPAPNAAISRLDSVNSGTTSRLVGAPIANSSLTA